MRHAKDVLWAGIDELPVPQYLSDNIERILAITSETYQTNEAFSRTIIDQILISAVYEERQTQQQQQQRTQRRASSSQPEEEKEEEEAEEAPRPAPAVLELQHETPFQRQVRYGGESRLLSGYADYTVWYEAQRKGNLATNLIVIEAKKSNATDTCLGQLTAYMGIAHARRKEDDERKQNAVIYGAASDGLSFRFCRIDNEGNWSQSRLMEWEMGDKGMIYSVFRSLIRLAALSSPSTSPVKNLEQRQKVLASFSSKERSRKFDFGLSALEILEEDDETEIISWRE